ncbi:hypothetical protein [Spirosoma knui]
MSFISELLRSSTKLLSLPGDYYVMNPELPDLVNQVGYIRPNPKLTQPRSKPLVTDFVTYPSAILC